MQRCGDRFPGLRILSGTELGEPHWHEDEVKALLGTGTFDRVLGSVHSLELDATRLVDLLFDRAEPAYLIRAYLSETLRLAESTAPFAVLAHIDYPVRHWPKEAGPFDATGFEDEYRAVLAALARSGRALEVNTRVPLPAVIVRWWYEAGGEALVFGSDARIGPRSSPAASPMPRQPRRPPVSTPGATHTTSGAVTPSADGSPSLRAA